MKTLEELVGDQVMLRLLHPILEIEHPILWTKLLAVEQQGVWIEGNDFAEAMQAKFKQPLPKTPLFFVPFAQIGWIFSVADYPFLSEKSLGLKQT